MAKLGSRYRTHTCKELSSANVGEKVSLSGWVMRKRDHGGIVFFDLRDHYGVTQIVFEKELGEKAQNIRVESVVRIEGEVLARAAELVNSKMETGEIEVKCSVLEVLSESEVLPFQIAEEDNAPEHMRLKSRFLELRKEKLHKNIMLRSAVMTGIREFMPTLGFSEFQTPILTASSPEGARDFVVPSRIHPGKFFALPQAPQQFKQLLMVAGFDRYYQIAPCFRDEDSRADRSPGEFYQLDLEMSFVEQDDILEVLEKITVDVFGRFSDWKMEEAPFLRMTHAESMAKYGSDKPDLRNPLTIQNVCEVFAETEFKVFKSVMESGGHINAIKVPVPEIPSRKYFDDLIAEFKKASGQGVAYLIFQEDGSYKGTVAKFFSEAEIAKLKEVVGIDGQQVVFFAAGNDKHILPHFGRLRDKLGNDFDLVDKKQFKFHWVVDFPLYEEDEHTGKVEFGHNPFSMPQGGMEALAADDPYEIKAFQWDLIINGYEIGSGAIRNHLPEVMFKAFEIAGYGPEVVKEKFGGMLNAFKYGAPPHGGFAFGMERIVMLLAEEDAIRDIIIFPLAQSVEDLMMGAPCELDDQALKDVHVKVELPAKLKKEQELKKAV